MYDAQATGDAILATARTIHFIPTNGGAEWSLPTILDMAVGTVLTGHLRICTDTAAPQYLEGTIRVESDGIEFDPA